MTLPNAGSINVLLFASYADAFGARQISAPIAAPCRVSDLVDALRTLPGGLRLPAKPLVAVNRTWSAFDAHIAVGDEVAVIPPVAGG
ncbi:MAG: MoaD/ThiS family protein [Gemmatimonas sp.]